MLFAFRAFPEFCKISRALPRVEYQKRIDVARYSMLPGAGRAWENTLRRPLELEVIDSEQFSLRHGLSSRAKIYAEVHPGETDNRHQVGMFPPRIRVLCRRRFHGSKMKGKKKEKTTASKNGQEIKIANRD